MGRVNAELSKDAQAIGFLCRFNQARQDEVEESLVIDDLVKLQALPGFGDRVDEHRRPRSDHGSGARWTSLISRQTQFEFELFRGPILGEFLLTGCEQNGQFCCGVGGSEVFEDGDFPTNFPNSLIACGPGAVGDFPQARRHEPIVDSPLVPQKHELQVRDQEEHHQSL
ncbi:hypothetical protein [Brevibacterium sp. CFH 10365]|uniref:hypothetical protein n=1 Tax=Brevibacterium sp. CFH 10365 TaxID=2585207 RepID=UPI001D0D4ED5|nr:hypothetical protein [Brevibacterium sp. CFH 10365]